MPRFASLRAGRPVRPRRVLSVLIPVAALLSGPVLPAPASAASAAAYPSTQAIKSWGTAKVDGKSRAQRVNAVVSAGGVAYLGGEFTKMVSPSGSKSYRNYLAAIDGTTGSLKSWNPKANGKVWAMELSADGKSVYVGGDFSKIGDRSVSKLARISLATGKLDTTFKPRSVKGRVRTLALDGDRLYVGGEFTSIDGKSRPKLAAVDASTGALLSWMPPPLGPGRYLGQTGVPTPDYSPGHVFAVEVIGGKVFAAGTFIDLGGQAGLVTVDAVTGALAEPQYDPGRPIFDLEAAGGMLYAAGGGPGGRLYAFSPDDDDPRWRAKVDGDAVGVAVSGTTVYLAGHYDFIVSQDSSCYQYCPGGPGRRHLAAFAADDGELLPWNPTADTSTGPYAAAVGSNALYVGGEFQKINGKAQPGFAIFPGAP
ncbi:MAG: PQQ-binding-like beta-propeller repeat protein [Actinomycetota bacterium]|jgi:outer membrane protein assembly factor BamB